MDTLASMRLFVQAVKSANFSAVARQLGVAPSSVSRQIDALEAALGARLLNRSTRKLHLTEAGQLYYERASRILADIEDANRVVNELEATPHGTLRISAPVNFGRLHVAPQLPQFLERYPEMQVDFSLSDQLVDLVEEGFDLAIRIADLKDSLLIARRLMDIRRVICASPAYLAKRGVPRHPDDLREHNCLTFRLYTANNLWRPGASVWRLSGAGGIAEVAVTGNLQANSADVLLAAALQGLGLVLVPTWLVCDDLQVGRLRPVLAEYQVSPLNGNAAIYAVYPEHRRHSPKVRAFVEFISERVRTQPLLCGEGMADSPASA
ncbi:MAG: LysR family transcriptional regulator [Gammaproteobacteria bacterium]